MEYRDLTEEQRAEIEGKSPKEILALAQEQGYELTDEELSSIAGGESVWAP